VGWCLAGGQPTREHRDERTPAIEPNGGPEKAEKGGALFASLTKSVPPAKMIASRSGQDRYTEAGPHGCGSAGHLSLAQRGDPGGSRERPGQGASERGARAAGEGPPEAG